MRDATIRLSLVTGSIRIQCTGNYWWSLFRRLWSHNCCSAKTQSAIEGASAQIINIKQAAYATALPLCVPWVLVVLYIACPSESVPALLCSHPL